MERIRLSIARRRALIVVALATLLGAAAWLSYAVAERVALQSLHEATGRRMDLYALKLGNEMRRFEYLPEVVRVHDLLYRRTPDGWRLEKSWYPKLRLAQADIASWLAEAGFALAHASSTRGVVEIVARVEPRVSQGLPSPRPPSE